MALEVDLKFSVRLSGKNVKQNSNWHEYVSFDTTVHDCKGYCYAWVMVDEYANQYIEYHKQEIIDTLSDLIEQGNIALGEITYGGGSSNSEMVNELEQALKGYDNKLKYHVLEDTDWIIKKEIRPIRWR